MAFFFIVGALLSYVLPVFMYVRHIKFCNFLVGTIAMMYLTPTFINVFVIYAISNLHDVSWGNRPSNAGLSKDEQDLKDEYEIFRSKFMLVWLLFNVAFGYIMIYLSRGGGNEYIVFVAAFVALILWLRLIFALCNRLLTCCDNSRLERHKIRRQRENDLADPSSGSVIELLSEEGQREEDEAQAERLRL